MKEMRTRIARSTLSLRPPAPLPERAQREFACPALPVSTSAALLPFRAAQHGDDIWLRCWLVCTQRRHAEASGAAEKSAVITEGCGNFGNGCAKCMHLCKFYTAVFGLLYKKHTPAVATHYMGESINII